MSACKHNAVQTIDLRTLRAVLTMRRLGHAMAARYVHKFGQSMLAFGVFK